MKKPVMKYLALLTLAMVMAIPLFAAKDKEKGEMTFNETTYNFGNIREDGGSVSHDFTFRNTGKGNLIVYDASAQCGCTRPEFPKNPVAPGKSSKIKVTYNPIGRPGSFEKVVTIRTNGKKNKTRIKISGVVIPKK